MGVGPAPHRRPTVAHLNLLLVAVSIPTRPTPAKRSALLKGHTLIWGHPCREFPHRTQNSAVSLYLDMGAHTPRGPDARLSTACGVYGRAPEKPLPRLVFRFAAPGCGCRDSPSCPDAKQAVGGGDQNRAQNSQAAEGKGGWGPKKLMRALCASVSVGTPVDRLRQRNSKHSSQGHREAAPAPLLRAVFGVFVGWTRGEITQGPPRPAAAARPRAVSSGNGSGCPCPAPGSFA